MKKLSANKPLLIVIFTEGETDKIFYNYLIKHLGKSENVKVRIHNLESITNYKSKAYRKLKNNILPKYQDFEIVVFLTYDTDVFELSAKPPINWKQVENDIKSLGINQIYHIKAKNSIEDWFLFDIQGICKFLKINIKNCPKKFAGKNGIEKISKLFKRANKIYMKGKYVDNFIEYLNFNKIYPYIKNEISELEKKLSKT